APKPVIAVGMTYASDPRMAKRTSSKKYVDDAIQGPRRGFWMDVLYAMIYPVTKIGNVINLGVLLLVVTFAQYIPFMSCFMTLLRFSVYGWTASVFMNIVSHTAAGDDDLPLGNMSGGWWEETLKPGLMFLGTFALAMLPLITYGLLSHFKLMPKSDVL